MRVVMTLLVRDEADVIETMLDCHFALGVDFVVATDNRSVDGTTEILERYAADGRLRLIHEPDDDYQQSRWVTRMARLAASAHGADWVINADADEIWWPASGDLRSTLASVPAQVAQVAARRVNFSVRPEDGRAFHERMLWRRTDSLTHDGALMGPKVCHRADPDVVVAVGNHAVDGLDGSILADDRIEILHFPLRTYRQYATKVEQGTAALERNAGYGPEVGYHWRSDAERQRTGTLRDAWARWTLDDEMLAHALDTGEIVEDHRLARLVSAVHGDGPLPWVAAEAETEPTTPGRAVRRIGGGVTYADGAEDGVLAVLRRAHDRSSGSAELARHIVDWPTRYHFSSQRSNLVAPFRIGAGQRVLDVGAGTGALSRYLGEQGAEVVALEGNPDRAAAAAARCRDLERVEVLCGALDDLDPDERFDVVVLCGVLEYAGSEIGGAGGAPAMAARARSHLRDRGAVIIAIENQLGLKYLLGAAEDHLARPWAGIDGYNGPPGVRTWSRRRLAAILADAGLSEQHWLAPFPDYKLPTVVLDEEIYHQPGAADLIDGLVPRPVVCLDHPPVRLADSAAAHRVWIEAGLGLDVANSFLVVAAPSEEALGTLVPDDALAWIFDGDRAPRWRRRRTLTADRRLVDLGEVTVGRHGWLHREPVRCRPFPARPTLRQEASAAVRAHDLDRLGALLGAWREDLDDRAVRIDPPADPPHPFLMRDTRAVLPGDHLDVGLANIAGTGDGFALLEVEWRTADPVDLRIVRHRALFDFARHLVLAGVDHPWGDAASIDTVTGELATLAGIPVDPAVVASWRAAERELRSIVAGQTGDAVAASWLDGSARAGHVGSGGPTILGRRGDGSGPDTGRDIGERIAGLEDERSELIGQVQHLTGVVTALEAQVAHLRRPRGFLAAQLRRLG